MPPTASTPTASIIILTRHDPRRLARCLAALDRLTDRVSHELLVLLNGADDDVRGWRVSSVAPVRRLESAVNLGFAGGCNAAARVAAGRYLVFLNDDTEVEAGWLQSLVEVAEDDVAVGAVGSCVLFPDGSVQEAGSIVWRDGSISAYGRGMEREAPALSFVRQVDYCSACSLLVRRDAWTAAGGFSEAYYPAYYEDVDLCMSLRARGYRVVYAPRSRVRHVGGSSTDASFRLFLNDHHRQRFRQRWHRVLERCEPPNPASPAALRRAAFRASGCLRRLLVVTSDAAAVSPGGYLHDTVVELPAAGYAVSVWARGRFDDPLRDMGRRGVETIAGSIEEHLREPGVLYDTVLIAAPQAYQRYAALLGTCQPQSVVVDANAVCTPRRAGAWADTLRQAQLSRSQIRRPTA